MVCIPTVDDKTNVVKTVNWTATASANVNSQNFKYSISGAKNIIYKNTENFTPYENLTSQQVLDWVWAVPAPINDPNYVTRTPISRKLRTEAQLKIELEKLITPPEVRPPLPWVTNN